MILIFIFKADYIYPKPFIPGNRVTKEDQRYNFFKLNIQINFLPPVFKIPVESVRYFKKRMSSVPTFLQLNGERAKKKILKRSKPRNVTYPE